MTSDSFRELSQKEVKRTIVEHSSENQDLQVVFIKCGTEGNSEKASGGYIVFPIFHHRFA
jgi:hypothetical protein